VNSRPLPTGNAGYFLTRCDVQQVIAGAEDIDLMPVIELPDRVMTGL
jgi:hypothetical protein